MVDLVVSKGGRIQRQDTQKSAVLSIRAPTGTEER